MRFTRKELAQAMGLKPGDKIRVWKTIFTINDEYSFISDNGYPASPAIFIDEEFEIVQAKKNVGEKLCMDFDCNKCPLFVINCDNSINSSLYEKLEQTFADVNDDELYNILKARLDKEVE